MENRIIIKPNKPRGYWTKERCHEEALKYNKRWDFRNGSGGAYNSSHRKGWIDEICTHMDNSKLPKKPFYWTKERCQKEALKFTSRSLFWEKAGGVCKAATKNGWYDEITKHMVTVNEPKDRWIYSIEFTKFNMIYVGLSIRPKKRLNVHLNPNKKSVVSDFMNEHNLSEKDYVLKLHGKYSESISQLKEDEILSHHISKGWKKLNKAKCGSLGGGLVFWDYENCKQEALKYNKRVDLLRKSKGAYESARLNGWLDEICTHMVSFNKWTHKENCKQEALKYNRRSEFQISSNGAYASAKKNKWLDEICPHMVHGKTKWFYENTLLESKKYNTRSKFQKGSYGAYHSALKNGWLDEFFPKLVRPSGFSSQYKGVCWDKKNKKWRASIIINGKNKYLGSFKCELEASESYQKALRELSV